MNSFWIVSIAVLVVRPAFCNDDVEPNRPPAAVVLPKTAAPIALPKVLRGSEPKDSRFLRLPGPPEPKPAAEAPAEPSSARIARLLIPPGWRPKGVPALKPAPEVELAVPMDNVDSILGSVAPPQEPEPSAPVSGFQPIGPPPLPSDAILTADPLSESLQPDDVPEPSLEVPSLPEVLRKPVYPSGFVVESAVYTQRQIGRWTLEQARVVFGEPRRSRVALGDDSRENGRIYAFRDPTNRYRELELDFEKDRGTLRTVFVYPWNLTWQDCRRIWGGNASAAQGSRGRTFYSYINRHLDVLVDQTGKVISLGLY